MGELLPDLAREPVLWLREGPGGEEGAMRNRRGLRLEEVRETYPTSRTETNTIGRDAYEYRIPAAEHSS